MNPADREPDIHFTPTPARVIAEMLRIAQVGAGDVVFDLGCGDGRILIAAALQCRARGVGIDLDPERIHEARTSAVRAGVGQRLELQQADFFTCDLRASTVVMLYLLDSLNVRLRPKILAECRPGTRVVSYSFEMGEWEPDAHTPIAANGVSLWLVPANLSGSWQLEDESGSAGIEALRLTQKFQMLSGEAVVGGIIRPIRNGHVNGSRFSLTIDAADGRNTLVVSGRADGDVIRAEQASAWRARRLGGTKRGIE